jgi:hypothetical protein
MAALTANPTTVDDDDIFLGKLLGFVRSPQNLSEPEHGPERGEGMTKDG